MHNLERLAIVLQVVVDLSAELVTLYADRGQHALL